MLYWQENGWHVWREEKSVFAEELVKMPQSQWSRLCTNRRRRTYREQLRSGFWGWSVTPGDHRRAKERGLAHLRRAVRPSRPAG